MDDRNRQRVRRALDDLKPYLETYVVQALADSRLTVRLGRPDSQKLISTMLQHWDATFASRLSATVRHYLFELKDIRNRWAHEEPFTDEEARRAEDTVLLVGQAIGAPVSRLRTKGQARSPVETRSTGTLRPKRQIDLLRELYTRHAHDEQKIIREYGEAERRGEVLRKSNTRGISGEEYARLLLDNALRRGLLGSG